MLDDPVVLELDDVLLPDVLPDLVELLELVVDVLDDLANNWNAPMLMCFMSVTYLLSWNRYCYCPKSSA